jgi:AhpD family alkylhydroperoxidase
MTVYRAKRTYTPRTLVRDLREILAHTDDFHSAANSDRVSRAFAERIMLTVTAVNDCRYCSVAHARMALRSGIAPEDVELLLGGEIGNVPPDEAPALLFAQHYAGCGGQPDPAMVQILVETYGPETANDILAHIRMITLGNLLGNTFDALLGRLRGHPPEGSNLGSEVATLGLLVLATPALGIAMGAQRLRRR